MRNVFEGIIWIFAMILVFYDYNGKDNIITTIAGICALGVALCPTHVSAYATCTSPSDWNNITGDFHNVFASAFFLFYPIYLYSYLLKRLQALQSRNYKEIAFIKYVESLC
jgi:hypothetical protein